MIVVVKTGKASISKGLGHLIEKFLRKTQQKANESELKHPNLEFKLAETETHLCHLSISWAFNLVKVHLCKSQKHLGYRKPRSKLRISVALGGKSRRQKAVLNSGPQTGFW